ncbi:hypothetical protein [Streptococcus parasanguinis]|jgi:hypothetical protein|uniref:Ethanolamine utilization cobalamin adenosyltransferase n=1 Tax=Streptococcus parasanguinis TaxID=1318 RepID=A0A414CKQ0_STRPA|nr:hypothetical protein [Streptococcus parasanguinis]MBT0924501.1 hypothetical protein [Streptococcus parasanguinis]MDU2419684.1 hypothetical protein [Streptococcus parasanguinis]MTS06263.1 hypothetical protein [Streptococcus parasanguinis]RHC95609.1 hypothetical protein DW820_00270 [Streptococcus parasanguinis]
MTVYTESRIRKLIKDGKISEQNILKLSNDDKLTPAAKGFLHDRHIQIVYSDLPNKTQTEISKPFHMTVSSLEESAVYPLLFKLTKLYTYFLKCQKELHLSYLDEKVDQLGILLQIVEKLVGCYIEEDISFYNPNFGTNEDLQSIRVIKQLDQGSIRVDFKCESWKLSCYELYIEIVNIRKELMLVSSDNQDIYAEKLIALLKSIEVLVWLILE